MKIIKIIILFIFSCNASYSQEAVTYHYVLNERIIATDSTVPIFGMEHEFTSVRKYFSQSTFSETRIFTGDNRKSILYKIENGIWYYKQENKWKLFYNYNKMIGGNILLFGLKYKIVFKGAVNIRNTTLHKVFLEPVTISQSHTLEYYFNPLKGVVIIQSSNGTILLRSDIFKSSLTDDEINLL